MRGKNISAEDLTAKKELALEVIRRLKAEYPDAGCTLDYDHAWQLLVSVRLAAQCTDARVNIVVQDLFAKYPSLAAPAWASGTALGIIAGNLLPLRAVSALSVALYGMFLAIIIPPARKDKIVAALVAISFALSFACTYLPGISALSDGTRTIILTVAISCAGALLFPVKTQSEEAEQ